MWLFLSPLRTKGTSPLLADRRGVNKGTLSFSPARRDTRRDREKEREREREGERGSARGKLISNKLLVFDTVIYSFVPFPPSFLFSLAVSPSGFISFFRIRGRCCGVDAAAAAAGLAVGEYASCRRFAPFFFSPFYLGLCFIDSSPFNLYLRIVGSAADVV